MIKKNDRFSQFNISVRLLNCLYSMDLIYVKQLTKVRMEDIKKYRMFGEKSQKELVEFMKSHNIYFLGEKPSQKFKQIKKYSEEDMRKMYDLSCGLIGLKELHDQTKNNERFKDLLEKVKNK